MFNIVMASLFWLMALAIVMTGKAEARPEIILPNKVEISQRPILRLGDIAQIRGGDEQFLSLVNNLVLREDARDLLLKQNLDSTEILKKIKAELDKDEKLRAANSGFKVPTSVEINFSSAMISKEEVTRKIENFMKMRCQDCEIQINLASLPNPNSRTWDYDFSSFNPQGGFILPIQENESRPTKWISGQIRIKRLTPVVTRSILQGERLNKEDLRLTMVDVTFAKDEPLRLEEIQGQLANRTLSAGSAVWAGDLKKEPAAKRGQILKALVGEGDIEISLNVESQESGFIGDIVKVRNLENQKTLSAKIVEKGVVVLQ